MENSGYTLPQYIMSRSPSVIHTIEPFTEHNPPNNFVRAAKWCWNGSSLLSQSENNQIRVLDHEYFDSQIKAETSTHRRILSQPSPILDFTWYPSASTSVPSTFCFLASVRECPVKLLDASDGRLRASYKIVDHRERQIAPHSLAFNLTADKIYCGFEDAIEIFDVNQPGEGTRLATTPSKKSKDGLKGIISALSFSPSYDYYATGSLSIPSSKSPNIALWSELEDRPTAFIGTDEFGPRAGVTQLCFNPLRPHILYAAFRRTEAIYSWDLRSDPFTPIKIFSPPLSNQLHGITNQKMRFDVDSSGRWLSTGRQNGDILIYDLGEQPIPTEENAVGEVAYQPDTQTIHPTLCFHAHEDAVGSVAFHPTRPHLLSTSGSRHFEGSFDGNSSSSGDSDSDDDDNEKSSRISTSKKTNIQPRTLDSSIKLWNFT